MCIRDREYRIRIFQFFFCIDLLVVWIYANPRRSLCKACVFSGAPLHGSSCVCLLYTSWTFIKRHRDCRSKIRLNLHTFLRSHKNFMSVNVRTEIYAFFLDFSKTGQGKHLKSARIRKNRSVPDHKFVKSAKLFYNFISGAHMKMRCV